MENKISVPKPCHENWNAMSPNEKGKFCGSCNKTVIDFTKMKNTEIQNYFLVNSKEEEICGHFKFNQVVSDSNSSYSKFSARFNRIKVRPIKFIALFLLGSLFSLSSCIMGKRAETIEESEVIAKDSIPTTDRNNKVQNEEQKSDSLAIQKESIKERK